MKICLLTLVSVFLLIAATTVNSTAYYRDSKTGKKITLREALVRCRGNFGKNCREVRNLYRNKENLKTLKKLVKKCKSGEIKCPKSGRYVISRGKVTRENKVEAYCRSHPQSLRCRKFVKAEQRRS